MSIQRMKSRCHKQAYIECKRRYRKLVTRILLELCQSCIEYNKTSHLHPSLRRLRS